GDRELGVNPATGKMVVAKDGRYGPYVTELEPDPEPVVLKVDASDPGVVVDPATGELVGSSAEGEKPKKKKAAKKAAVVKPRTASLFKSMDPAGVDLETAIRLLDLPRTVGQDPESGEDITAQNGRYGPYIKKGTDSRSLDSEELIFTIDLPAALEVFAQPKYGAHRPSSALKEFDADPVSGKPIRVREGRFGPYVTDGVTNATIPRGDDVETIDFERAVELLADKRAKGPAKPKSRARTPAKRAPAKRK
ncbi:MAG: topA, partial [Schumannella sp.]|nr:topA [Schumannella sp.]